MRLSSVIISSAIVPRFKANDYSGGIERGVDGIISVLNGDTTDWQPKVDVREDSPAQSSMRLFPILFFLFFVLVFMVHGRPDAAARRRGTMSDAADSSVFVPYSGSSWSSGSGWGWQRRRRRFPAAVGSPAAVVRRAAAARRGAGDAPSHRRTMTRSRPLSREAEKRTCGQIVCVLAHASSDYAYIPILWASVLALLVPWPLIYFTHWSVQKIFLLQLAVFIVAGIVFSWMPLRMALVPRPLRRAQAHRCRA